MMTEAFAEFFAPAEFASTATIGAVSVNGILDRPTADALDYAAGRRVTFVCAESALPAITLGSTTLTIGATTWVIVADDDDGAGVATLTLEAQ